MKKYFNEVPKDKDGNPYLLRVRLMREIVEGDETFNMRCNYAGEMDENMRLGVVGAVVSDLLNVDPAEFQYWYEEWCVSKDEVFESVIVNNTGGKIH